MNRFREVIKKKVFNNEVVIVKNVKSHLSNKWLYVMFYSGVKHFEYQQLCLHFAALLMLHFRPSIVIISETYQSKKMEALWLLC